MAPDFATRRFWWLPRLTPCTFLLALILFPLPWIEVQCPIPANWRKPGGADHATLTQSGLQAVYGAITVENRDASEKVSDVGTGKFASPGLAVFALFMLAGLLFGLFLSVGYRRVGILGSCCSIAAATLLAHAVCGFQLANQLREENAKVVPENACTIRYTVWFYGAWGATLIPLALIAAEGWMYRRRSIQRPALVTEQAYFIRASTLPGETSHDIYHA